MTFDEVVRDKDFQGLPFGERRKVLAEIDQDYAGLPDAEQNKVLVQLKSEPFWGGAKPQMQPAHTPGARVMPETVGEKVRKAGRTMVAPTAPAQSLADWAGRVVPESAVKLLPRMATGAYEMVKGQTDPIIKGFTSEFNNPNYRIGEEMRRNAGQSLAGLAVATTSGLGFGMDEGGNVTWSPSNATNVWASDPVGAGVGLAALGKGRAATKGKTTPPQNKPSASTSLQQERGELSRQFDVPLTVGEIRGNVGLKNIETQLERVPVVGIRSFREKQSASLRNAAEQLVDTITTGTEDAGRTMQTSMLGKMQKGKDLAKQAYDRVEAALTKKGVEDSIAPTSTRQAAKELLDEYPDIFDRLPAGAVKSKLAVILQDTTPKAKTIQVPMADTQGLVSHGKTPTTAILDEFGKPIKVTEPVTLTFKDARFLREQLNNYISRARKSAGAVGDKEIRRLSILKSAIDGDIKTWAESSANRGVRDAFVTANKVYQREVAPFKEFIVKKATGDEFDTDLMVKTFVKNDRPQLAAKLMRLMDNDGKAAVKHAILKDALELGTETKTDVPFSPAKFAGRLERYGKTLDSIFSPEELAQVNGFVKLSRVAERAGQFAESPPTGLRAGDIGITASAGYGIATNPLATGGAAVAIKFMSYMLTSNTGRKLLTRAAKTPENSGAMRGLTLQMGRQWEEFKRKNPKLAEQYGKIKDKKK